MTHIDDGVANHKIGFFSVMIKATIVHTATYMLMGIFALNAFNYAESFSLGPMEGYMLSIDDPLIMFGPALQPIRGLLFGLVFYLLRDVLFIKRMGWLTMWLMLILVGILNPFSPAPGSIEAAIYTNLTYTTLYEISNFEVYAQALALSLGVFYWVRNPSNRWLTWIFSLIAAAAIIMPLVGYYLAPLAENMAPLDEGMAPLVENVAPLADDAAQ